MQLKLLATAPKKEPAQSGLASEKPKPKRQRVANPQYKAIPLEWRLMAEGPRGFRDGTLEISFRTTDDEGNKTAMSFPCFLSDTKCHPRKVGTMRKVGPDGDCVAKVDFSIVGNCTSRLNPHMMILNNIVEDAARAISDILSTVSRMGVIRIGNLLEGVHLLNPKIMRIPKMVTAREISLEYLQEEGMLDLVGTG